MEKRRPEKTVAGRREGHKVKGIEGQDLALEERRAQGHKSGLDVLCAVVGAGALAAVIGGSLCGCSIEKLVGYEKLENPAEVVSIEVAGAATLAANEASEEEVSLYVVRLANPGYAPDGMEPLDSAEVAEIEEILTSRVTYRSDKTGVARAYLKSGKMLETTRVYTAKVAGEDVYVVKVFDNGAVVVLTPKEQAEQEARDAEDAAAAKAEEEAEKTAALNARYELKDTKGLRHAGVPAGCAARLSGDFSKWCKKNKLQPIDGVSGSDVVTSGKTCTVTLSAADMGSAEGKTFEVVATWDGKKLSFAYEKGSEG